MKILRAAITACGLAVALNAAGQTVSDPSLTVENVKISGTLSRPISLIFLSANDMLIAEQHTGEVKRMINGVVQAGNVLNLTVATASEQGLLSMVKDPEFATNNYIYVYYTHAASDGAADENHRIARFTWNGSALVSRLDLFPGPNYLPSTPGANHNGGVLVFGPPNATPANQKLFCVIGDLNRNNQTENYSGGAAPDDTAVIIRINKDGTAPTDNPFYNAGTPTASISRIYAYGIRNSFGMDFDPHPSGNALWDTENGPGGPAYDEINRVDPGFNSGWEYRMGPVSRGNTISGGASGIHSLGAAAAYSDPEFSWVNAVAPAGIHFFRGNGLGANYLYDCFVGDNNLSNIYKFELNAARNAFVLTGDLADLVYDTGNDVTQIRFGTGFGVPVDIDTGPDGNLYVVSLFGGTIYRIKSTTAVTDWVMY